jgi:hypothetical protein
VIGLLLAGALASSAANKTWIPASGTNDWWADGNWDPSGAPGAGDEVIIANAGAGVLLTNSTPYLGSLLVSNTAVLLFGRWNTMLSATNITVASNATITCVGPFTDAQMSNNVYLVCTNLTLDPGGRIDANGRGFQGGLTAGAGNGPGKGPAWGTGAGHGGYGGHRPASAFALGGAPYDAANAPALPGSGAGDSFSVGQAGGSGGGAVRIDARSGTVTLHGTISAQGGNGTAAYAGGGAGGSVWIVCRILAGTGGLVSVAGGSASGNANWAGGGGGGRIAVLYNTADQVVAGKPAIRFSAAHGANGAGNPASYGTPGTLYFPDASLLEGAWFPHAGQLLLESREWKPASLTLSNNWVSFPMERFNLTVSNEVLIAGTASRLDIGGDTFWRTVTIDASAFPPFFYSATTSPPTLHVGGSLTITNGGKLYVHGGITNIGNTNYGALVSVTGDLVVAGNSLLVSRSHPSNGGSPLFRVQNLVVLTNGLISAAAAGFCGGDPLAGDPAYGPGRSTAGAAGGGPAGGWGAGAGYGGQGCTNSSGFGGGPTYGSSNAPCDPGSGGRGYGDRSGFGGGVIRVEALKTIRIDGTVNAKGGYGWNSWSGGGSGGGIYLRCARFTGNPGGSLSAAGGDGEGKAKACSAGGGGRIAIWRITDAFQGAVNVDSGSAPGFVPINGSGTIVWGQLSGASGTVIVIR